MIESISNDIGSRIFDRLFTAAADKISLRRAWRDPNVFRAAFSKKLLSDLRKVIGNDEGYDELLYEFIDYLNSSAFLYFLAACCYRNNNFNVAKAHFRIIFLHYFPDGSAGVHQEISCDDFFSKLKGFTLVYLNRNGQNFIAPDDEEQHQIEEQITQQMLTYSNYVKENFYEDFSFKNRIPLIDNRTISNAIKIVSKDSIPLYKSLLVYGPSAQRQEVNLDDVYVDIPVMLDSVNLNKSAYSLKISEVFTYSNSIAVLGSAGAGKTTGIKNFTLETLQTNAVDGAQFPLYLQVRDIAKNYNITKDSLFKIVENELSEQFGHSIDVDMKLFVKSLLSLGKLTIIFDGLDEIVSPEKRVHFSQKINQLVSRYPDCKYLISCRDSDFKILKTDQFASFKILPFNADQQVDFFQRFLSTMFPEKKNEAVELLNLFQIQTRRHVTEFLGNPLLLTLLVWNFLIRHQIPDDRIKLYGECAELLFQKWDSIRDINVGVEQSQLFVEISASVATYLAERERLSISHEELQTVIGQYFENYFGQTKIQTAREVTEQFMQFLPGRAALIRGSPEVGYEFVHRTFLEYFYGKYVSMEYVEGSDFIDKVLSNASAGKHHVAMVLAIQSWTQNFAGPRSDFVADKIIEFIKHEVQIRDDNDVRKKRIDIGLLVDFCTDVIACIRASEEKIVGAIQLLITMKIDVNDWYQALNKLTYAYKEKEDVFIEAIANIVAAEILDRKYRSISRVTDWIKILKIYKTYSGFAEYELYLPTLEKFGLQLYSKVTAEYDDEISSSLEKIHFDLNGHINTEKVTKSGQLIWDFHKLTNDRFDWRLVDAIMCIDEFLIATIDNQFSIEQSRYVKLFYTITKSERIHEPFRIQVGKIITLPTSQYKWNDVIDLAKNCPIDFRCAVLLSLVVIIEIVENSGLNIQELSREVLKKNLVKFDLNSGPFSCFINKWLDGETAVFRSARRPSLLPSDQLVNDYLGVQIIDKH